MIQAPRVYVRRGPFCQELEGLSVRCMPLLWGHGSYWAYIERPGWWLIPLGRSRLSHMGTLSRFRGYKTPLIGPPPYGLP